MKENNPQTPELISGSSASSTFACAFLSSSFCFVICTSVMLNWGLTYWYTVDTPSDSHQSFLLRRLDVSKLQRLQRRVKSLALKGSISGLYNKKLCHAKPSYLLSADTLTPGLDCRMLLATWKSECWFPRRALMSPEQKIHPPEAIHDPMIVGGLQHKHNFWVRSRLPYQNAKPTAKRGDCWD